MYGEAFRSRPPRGPSRPAAPRRVPFLLAAALLPLALSGCDARLHLYIHAGRETLLPGRAYGDALMVQGFAASVPPGRALPTGEPARPFVLRLPMRPPDWNGGLVIGAHRGVGGIRRGAEGRMLGSGATELDDLVGMWALDQGFAWASLDRAGLGTGPEAHRLVEAFARLMFDQVRPRLARDPDFLVLFGYGEGGGLARYAASAAEPTFDGVVLVSANLGDPASAARRRETRLELAKRWRESDEARARYQEAAGTGSGGARFWPFFDAVATGPAAVLPAPPAALRIPVIEVVGTMDDFVLPEVLAFRERVQEAGGAPLHELRLVDGAWRVGPGDDALEEFQAWAAEVGLSPGEQEALGSGRGLGDASRRALADLAARFALDGAP